MSVYIKGMEMPENCLGCHLRDAMMCAHGGSIPSDARYSNCPLIPVPDHGRLIDADFIVKRLRKQIQDVGEDTELANRDREFISIIGAVSTIIPASKEDGE